MLGIGYNEAVNILHKGKVIFHILNEFFSTFRREGEEFVLYLFWHQDLLNESQPREPLRWQEDVDQKDQKGSAMHPS